MILEKIPLSAEVVTKEEFDTSIADINNDIEELSAELLPFKESVSSDISALRVSTNTLSSSFSDRLSALDTDTRLRDEALSQSITNNEGVIYTVKSDVDNLSAFTVNQFQNVSSNYSALVSDMSELGQKHASDFGELHNYVTSNTVLKTDFETKTNELSNAVSALTQNTQTTTDALESRTESLETNVNALSTQVDVLSSDLSQLSTKHSEDYSILDGRITSENNSITADLNAFKTTTEENINNLDGRITTTESQILDSGSRLDAITLDTAILSAYLNALSNATETDIATLQSDLSALEATHSSHFEILNSDISSTTELLNQHEQSQDNPHAVTANQVGALPISGGMVEGNVTIAGNVIADSIKMGSFTTLSGGRFFSSESSTVVSNKYGPSLVLMNGIAQIRNYTTGELAAEFGFGSRLGATVIGSFKVHDVILRDEANIHSDLLNDTTTLSDTDISVRETITSLQSTIASLQARIEALEAEHNPEISG